MRSRWAALTAVAGMLVLFAGCSESAPPFNDTPVLQNIFPSNITAGSGGFTLFIQGSGFIANSMGVSFAYWNGSPRSTFFNTVTGQLQVQIPASDVATATSANVTVVNPAPGGGMSQVVPPLDIFTDRGSPGRADDYVPFSYEPGIGWPGLRAHC